MGTHNNNIKKALNLFSKYINNEIIPPKILYRDEELKKIERNLQFSISSIIIGIIPGTGKTVSLKYLMNKNKDKYNFAYIDCRKMHNISQILREFCSSFGIKLDTKTRMYDIYTEKLRNYIEKSDKKVCFIVDEIDDYIRTDKDNLELLNILADFTGSYFGKCVVFMVTNDCNLRDFLKNMHPKIFSRLVDNIVEFGAYDIKTAADIIMFYLKHLFNLSEEKYYPKVLKIVKEVGVTDMRSLLKLFHQIIDYNRSIKNNDLLDTSGLSDLYIMYTKNLWEFRIRSLTTAEKELLGAITIANLYNNAPSWDTVMRVYDILYGTFDENYLRMKILPKLKGAKLVSVIHQSYGRGKGMRGIYTSEVSKDIFSEEELFSLFDIKTKASDLSALFGQRQKTN